MRLLADENIPGRVVRSLRASGHDVAWVSEQAPSIEDQEVLAWAQRESRVLITLDKDFGELAFVNRSVASRGVVLLRVDIEPEEIASILQRLFEMDLEVEGNFVVVEGDRVRVRPLPQIEGSDDAG